VRINNYSQLDWQSGKAPDFEEKDPLASLFVCPTQGVTSIRRFQFRKRAQFFISTHIRAHASARAVTKSNSPRTRVSPVAIPQTQLDFIGPHNEMFSIVAVRVSNSDNHPSEA
jgi:hypothetical protein